MEDFDQLYEDELELMREMEDGEARIRFATIIHVRIKCTFYTLSKKKKKTLGISDHPRPRRALKMSSPSLTPGSRKRPSENSPLPLLNLDPGDSPGEV